jgi:SAM-dependent methyltransferase
LTSYFHPGYPVTDKASLASDKENSVTRLTELDAATARDWIGRWERQQEVYLADREERFTALIDAVEAGSGRPDPLVVDLGCGPGSLAVRLLDRLPAATVVAVDADPVTLSLGRTAYAGRPGLRFADVDLRVPGWESGLGLGPGQQADAVVSTTALHWLSGHELRALYRALAVLLRRGGLFLDGDHLRTDQGSAPVLAGIERALEEREALRCFPDGHAGRAEDWGQWWRAATADPALTAAAAERARRGLGAAGHGQADGGRLDTHVGALVAAGFAEVGTIWQRGGNRLLCAVR